MKPRITVSLTADGLFEIFVNPEGRDLLVRELQHLSERWDHFHLAPEDMGEVPLSTTPYRADDRVLEWGTILFRTDEWDRQYFPHVMVEDSSPS